MSRAEKKSQRPQIQGVSPATAPPVEAGVSEPVAPSLATKVPGRPDPEVVPGPRRRTFTAEFKRQVLEAVEACSEPGEVGAILRKHGLYSSHLSEWRHQRDEGLKPKKRGRKVDQQRAVVEENAKLKREKVQLEERLRRAEIIIDCQKKLSQLLGIPLTPPPRTGSDE